MTVITNHSDYLQKRLAGEQVISIASVLGIEALRQFPILKDFEVLSLDFGVYSIYSYRVEQGKFRVTEMHESLSHALIEKMPCILLKDQTTIRWWNCVFFGQDGKRQYDNAYDDLLIAENNELSFKDIINCAKKELSRLIISKHATHILLTGDLAFNPLVQYILQTLFPSKVIVPLQINLSKDIEENHFVMPNKKVQQMSIHTNHVITLSSLVSQPICVIITLDASMDSIMLPNLKWKDIITDKQKDYTVHNLDFKKILLRVDYDAFSNTFITSEDMHGHRKVVLIN